MKTIKQHFFITSAKYFLFCFNALVDNIWEKKLIEGKMKKNEKLGLKLKKLKKNLDLA